MTLQDWGFRSLVLSNGAKLGGKDHIPALEGYRIAHFSVFHTENTNHAHIKTFRILDKCLRVLEPSSVFDWGHGIETKFFCL